MRRNASFLITLLVLLVGTAGCTTTRTSGTESRAHLEGRIALNPSDAQAHRDLGVLLAGEEEFPRALESLQRAFDHQPNDPKTIYYLGLVNETLGREDIALRLYEQYATVPANSEYRQQLFGRYQWLLRRQVRNEFRQRMAEEATIAQVAGDAVGVLPFTFRDGASRFEPLGRGLAELVSSDLANFPELTLVERVRMQVLLDELELARTGAVDPASAPQYGRLLRANRLVGGQYGVRNNQLVVDAGVFSAELSEDLPDLSTTEGSISNLLEIKNRVVASVLVQLGIVPTPEQAQLLNRIPTQNMDAFLAYSRGLQAGDSGDFVAATRFFNQALSLDPSFSEASRMANESAAIQGQNQEAAELLASAQPSGSGGAVGFRTSRLNQTISTGLIPGVDSRDPVVEGLGAGVLGDLPDPPPPPDN